MLLAIPYESTYKLTRGLYHCKMKLTSNAEPGYNNMVVRLIW